MKKVFILAILIFLFNPSVASASLVTKTRNNEIEVKVLGANTFSLNSAAESIGGIISNFSISIEENNLILSLSDKKVTKNLNLENFEGDVLEIQRNEDKDRVVVASKDGSFYIKQRGVLAATNHTLSVNNNENKLILNTEDGDKYIYVYPYEALEPLIKTKLIDEIAETGEINLIELEEGEIVYLIKGVREHNILGLFNLPVNVEISVSAKTGNVISIDAPTWSKILNILNVS